MNTFRLDLSGFGNRMDELSYEKQEFNCLDDTGREMHDRTEKCTAAVDRKF